MTEMSSGIERQLTNQINPALLTPYRVRVWQGAQVSINLRLNCAKGRPAKTMCYAYSRHRSPSSFLWPWPLEVADNMPCGIQLALRRPSLEPAGNNVFQRGVLVGCFNSHASKGSFGCSKRSVLAL